MNDLFLQEQLSENSWRYQPSKCKRSSAEIRHQSYYQNRYDLKKNKYNASQKILCSYHLISSALLQAELNILKPTRLHEVKKLRVQTDWKKSAIFRLDLAAEW